MEKLNFTFNYDEISLRPILLPIKHDKKLVFKKRGSVVYVGLE